MRQGFGRTWEHHTQCSGIEDKIIIIIRVRPVKWILSCMGYNFPPFTAVHWCTMEWVDGCFDRAPNDDSSGNLKCLQFMVRLCSPILSKSGLQQRQNILIIFIAIEWVPVESNKLIGNYLLIRYTRLAGLELMECLFNQRSAAYVLV